MPGMNKTYEVFEQLVEKTFPGDGSRYGKHWFNTLFSVRPDIANELRGTHLDPVNRDIISDELRSFTLNNW
jgi:hypothetical protein